MLQYEYDAAGRVSTLTQQLARLSDPANPNSNVTSGLTTWSAGYDAVGRLTTFNNGSGNASFTYDANGNRSTSNQVIGGQNVSRGYTLSGNRAAGFSQTIGSTTSTVAYGYNANGDLTSDGLRSFVYDAEGRLSDVTTGATDVSPTTRYAHNALGQRVFKTEPLFPPAEGDENDPGFMQSLINFFKQFWNPTASNGEALGYAYVYDEEGNLLGDYGMGGANSGGGAGYVYLPTANGPIPIVVMGATTRWAVLADHLNTPRRLTRPDGQLEWQWGYSAFGDGQPTIASNKFAAVATVTGDFEFNLRYPGQYFDRESGLHYNYFRSYSPTTGRYTQGDPIGLDGGWNRFGYVDANPLSSSDPKGLAAMPSVSTAALKPIPEMSPALWTSPTQADACAASNDSYGKRKAYCLAFCQYELDMPGRFDNFGPHRACMRRCMGTGGFTMQLLE